MALVTPIRWTPDPAALESTRMSRNAAPAPNPTAHAASSVPTADWNPTVLVVDDHPANVSLLSAALRDMGIQVLSATDGPTALARMDEHTVDLVLLDAVMPGMSGFEVARAIRTRRPNELLPIVMVTALDSQEDLERAFEAGANDFVRKPVNVTEVRARVKSFLFLRRQERQLAAALRSARALTEFQQDLAALLVHDLKGPLATIRVLTQLIRDELSTNPEAVPSDLAEIERTCEKLSNMVLGLIDISRLEQAALVIERKPVDLGALARDALNTFAAQAAARNIAFEAHGEATIMGDPSLLARVVSNLVENAITHTPAHGAVIVCAGGDTSGRRVLRVTNTGSTLPMAERERIFDKYAGRSTRTRTSRGLGLYFCKLVVEAHGGTIGVQGPEQGPISFVIAFEPDSPASATNETTAPPNTLTKE